VQVKRGMWREKEKRGQTHVEGFEVFAHFGDELFTAFVVLLEDFIWRMGKEMTLCERMLRTCTK
jgi:hypothetical protein